MEEATDDATLDEGHLGEVDDDVRAGGECGVELGSKVGNGGNVVLAEQRDHHHLGQVFDDDLADLWHSAPPTQAAEIGRGITRVGKAILLPVYPLRQAGSPSKVVTTNETPTFDCDSRATPRASRGRASGCAGLATRRGSAAMWSAVVQLAVTEAATNAVSPPIASTSRSRAAWPTRP